MVAKRIVTVVGATGAQGGSVVDCLLTSKSQEYAVRAVTRSPGSAAAKDLAARGVEVVQAELTDAAALREAFAGSYAVFAVTNFWGLLSETKKQYSAEQDVAVLADHAAAVETQMGINMTDAALATDTLQHYFWSTLTDTYAVSGGKEPASALRVQSQGRSLYQVEARVARKDDIRVVRLLRYELCLGCREADPRPCYRPVYPDTSHAV